MGFVAEDKIISFVDFDSGICLHPEISTNIIPINQERTNISKSCENFVCIRSKGQYNCFCNEEHASIFFVNPKKLWDMDTAVPLALNHTPDKDITTLEFAQPSTHQHETDICPVFFSLKQLDGKRKGLCVSFASSQKNTLPDG